MKRLLRNLALCPEPGALEAMQRAVNAVSDSRNRPFDMKSFYRKLIEEGWDVVALPPPPGYCPKCKGELERPNDDA